jgi:hypothetical protein
VPGAGRAGDQDSAPVNPSGLADISGHGLTYQPLAPRWGARCVRPNRGHFSRIVHFSAVRAAK